ncbi:putative secreted protein (Por secretion system target) [Lutibacter sp. Hel_I_33_5]|uniref:T9SS type A sorting domain-containing protein n=1 Tax=Lutibacter sp. Hel_I_33_5 TaxID=1566289 RepID=UPI00119F08E3|nr:T9SS type A sorting domain-containing protein [Lutibacter sp. Hel_I_33_5]TVZ55769.1 putative secreted protein (Por secretion system target) [Lutibacter sp. Hel_I_33_5]
MLKTKKKLKTIARIKFLFIIFLTTIVQESQSQPKAKDSNLTITKYISVKNAASSIGYDPISKSIFYTTVSGNVYRVIEGTPNSDILMFDVTDHKIKHLQGMHFSDNSLFLVGNDWTDGTQGIGLIKKGTLQGNDGSRNWSTVIETALYPATKAAFDHGFSGITIDREKKYLYLSSGSRTDHGELQEVNGLFKGIREVPLTSAIFRFPIDSENLMIPNNLAIINTNGWLFADGTRNSFGLAFNSKGDLFGVDNSGDRDDHEELNHIQKDHHYGFPWKMGTNDNPQQFPGYDPDKDLLVNKNSKAYKRGLYYDDNTFPKPPANVTFTDPIENMGPDANYYRDPSDGKVYKSKDGESLGTFTMHRSPLGLVFDQGNILKTPYTGSGFTLSFTQGKGDENGYLSNSIWRLPVVPIDGSQDLIHLDIIYDQNNKPIKVKSTVIADGFNFPVGSVLVDNNLYVLEYGTRGNRFIWKIELPKSNTTSVKDDSRNNLTHILYPNPVNQKISIKKSNSKINYIKILDITGKLVTKVNSVSNDIDVSKLSKGIYFMQIFTEKSILTRRFVKN